MTGHDSIRAALAHIPACDREVWLRMGMAVKSELGEAGFDIWDEWSQKDESYRAADAKAVWRSISPNGKVTVGTMFHEAQRHGFRWNGHARPESPSAARSSGASVRSRRTTSGNRANAPMRRRWQRGCSRLRRQRGPTIPTWCGKASCPLKRCAS